MRLSEPRERALLSVLLVVLIVTFLVLINGSGETEVLPGEFVFHFLYWKISKIVFWFAAVILFAALTVTALRLGKLSTLELRSRKGLCLQCGYDLRQSQNRCPECGMPFESRNKT